MNSCMSSAALEHLAWIELNFERGTPSVARELRTEILEWIPKRPS